MKSSLKNIPLEYIKKRLEYIPETGELIWKNGQRKGKNAGCITSNVAGNKYRYLSIGYEGKNYNFLAHVLCLCIYHNTQFINEVDHFDGNGLNNKFSNLRQVNRSVNNKNHRKQRNNSSGIAGIVWRERLKKWQAYGAGEDRKQVYLGVYSNFLDACCARKFWEINNNFTERHGK